MQNAGSGARVFYSHISDVCRQAGGVCKSWLRCLIRWQGRGGKTPRDTGRKQPLANHRGEQLSGVMRLTGVMALALALISVMPFPTKAASARCVELPPCKGCGCRGGPGYRSQSSGKCVGYKALQATCGDPPTLRCDFENMPESGLNKDCVLGKKSDQPD